jgi:hypothetical protein
MRLAAVFPEMKDTFIWTVGIAAGMFFYGSHLGLRAGGTRRERSIRGVGRFPDNGRTVARNSVVREMRSSFGMRMDNSLSETSTAACVRLKRREPPVLLAFSISSQQKPKFCALASELGSQFSQQRWQFRVSSKMRNPAGLTKNLFHEMDLKVRELSLSGAAKYLTRHTLSGAGAGLVALQIIDTGVRLRRGLDCVPEFFLRLAACA